jgi:hypothetical protein
VHTISSPSCQSRDAVRESAKFSVVMFAPNATSSIVALRKRAAVVRARSMSASERREVSNAPPRFALSLRK